MKTKNVRNTIIFIDRANQQTSEVYYSIKKIGVKYAQKIIGKKGSVERVECIFDAR